MLVQRRMANHSLTENRGVMTIVTGLGLEISAPITYSDHRFSHMSTGRSVINCRGEIRAPGQSAAYLFCRTSPQTACSCRISSAVTGLSSERERVHWMIERAIPPRRKIKRVCREAGYGQREDLTGSVRHRLAAGARLGLNGVNTMKRSYPFN